VENLETKNGVAMNRAISFLMNQFGMKISKMGFAAFRA